MLAEAFEGARDIEGAIWAYEKLLALEPPNAPGLPPNEAARRGVQELVLLSHRRGLQDTRVLSASLQRAADESVASVVDRGLQDVEAVRSIVRRDLDFVEETLESTLQQREKGERGGGLEQLGAALETTLLGNTAAAKALGDLKVMRKIAENDLNRLQRTVLRGDPLYAFLRDTWQRARGLQPPPVPLDRLSEASTAGLWLREQFERGVLPRDPQLVASLLLQSRRDPDLVTRLVSDMLDAGCGQAAADGCALPEGGLELDGTRMAAEAPQAEESPEALADASDQ